MLNFLLDIAPDKSQLLLTIKLAGILREKKQEVYYTYTSNPAFTPVLYDKGISNCVLYPDDFRWLKPDLTLLDCRHAAHASLYRQLAIVSIRPRACFFPLFSFLPLWLHYNLNPLCVQY